MSSEGRWSGRDGLLLVLVVAAAAVVRLAFVARLDVAPFDPWRHLLLVDAVRSGRGFTLFDGQPYLWYAPWWHTLVAWLPARLGALGAATILSSAVPGALYALVRLREGARPAALAAGLLAALLGPLTAFTCHQGSEAAALLLMCLAPLAMAAGRGPASAGLAGLLAGAGLVLRLNFLFDLCLLAPALRTRGRALAAAAGAAAPLAWLWWRNARIIAANDWLFTWDGLAVPADGFGPLGALLPQRHPDVAEALSRLHAMIVPLPEWIQGPDGWRPDLILFMALATAVVLAARRLDLIAAFAGALVYFLVLDDTGSANFFRIYLPVMVPVVLAAGSLVARAWPSAERAPRRAALAICAGLALLGARYLSPQPMVTLAAVNPPPALIRGVPSLFVNSAYYHPESVMYAHPDVRILGLPLRPEELAGFLEAYPGVDGVLWHGVSVQEGVVEELGRLGWREVGRARNDAGHLYRLFHRGAQTVGGRPRT